MPALSTDSTLCCVPPFHMCITDSTWHISATHDKGSVLKDKSVTLLQLRLQSFVIDLHLTTAGKNMAAVLKAIIVHSRWHRRKDKLHRCFSCCVILIPERTSAGWHSSTFLRATRQVTSKGVQLLERHRELQTPAEVLALCPVDVKSCLERGKQQVFAGRAFLVTLTEPCTKTNSMPLKSQPSASVPLYLGQEILPDDYTVVRAATIH